MSPCHIVQAEPRPDSTLTKFLGLRGHQMTVWNQSGLNLILHYRFSRTASVELDLQTTSTTRWALALDNIALGDWSTKTRELIWYRGHDIEKRIVCLFICLLKKKISVPLSFHSNYKYKIWITALVIFLRRVRSCSFRTTITWDVHLSRKSTGEIQNSLHFLAV